MEHLVTGLRPGWGNVSCEKFEGTSVPQEERRAQGSLCKPAWLEFYPFFAKTSRYCLDGGKVELRAVLAGGMEFDTGCKTLQELEERIPA